MQRVCRALRPFVGSRLFYRSALSVMIPVTVQQLINNLFNMVDNIMVGSLDIEGLAMSAVSVANKPYLIFFGIFFGLTGAGGLMISQYYGANDQKTCQGLFSLQLLLGIANSLLFFLLLFLVPEQVMRIFVQDERTIALGVKYLRIVCISYIPVAISNTCIFSMRALGQNKMSMVVSILTMGVNATFNYVLIFGKMGFPAMGVEGAAWGTVIARVFEMCIYLWLLVGRRMAFSTDFLAVRGLSGKVVQAYAKRAIPLIINELLWTVGMNMFFWCYARVEEAALPAITISELCFQLAAVMAMGTSSAVSVLIGTELGANELKKAKDNCKKLILLVLIIGFACMVLCMGLGLVLPNAFAISNGLRILSVRIACLLAVFAPFNFVYSFCFYCFRAGGDTRSAMMLDSGFMWILPVPASLLMGFFMSGHISVFTAVMVVQLLMSAKIFLALHMLRKGRWIRNITMDMDS